jgi:hypothetical protein
VITHLFPILYCIEKSNLIFPGSTKKMSVMILKYRRQKCPNKGLSDWKFSVLLPGPGIFALKEGGVVLRAM